MGKVVTFNGKYVKGSSGRIASVSGTPVDPYNPLGLPPYTIRLKYTDGVTPTFSSGTATQVSSSPNIWDLTYNNNNWSDLLSSHTILEAVLGANTTGITNMFHLFDGCISLESVTLFDTSGVADFRGLFDSCRSLVVVPVFPMDSAVNVSGMFSACSSLESSPLLDTSHVTRFSNMYSSCSSLRQVPLLPTDSAVDVIGMFYACRNVETGALALYTQMSTQATPPTTYSNCFTYCGSNTTTGAAELAQIPTSWGGSAT